MILAFTYILILVRNSTHLKEIETSLNLSMCCLGQRFRAVFPVSGPKSKGIDKRILVLELLLLLEYSIATFEAMLNAGDEAQESFQKFL